MNKDDILSFLDNKFAAQEGKTSSQKKGEKKDKKKKKKQKEFSSKAKGSKATETPFVDAVMQE